MLLVSIARRAYYAFLVAAFVALYLQGHSSAHDGCHPRAATRVLASDTLRGQLLVATPTIDDGYFQGTRIYLVEHDRTGALGVVLNKSEIAPGVWDGGPVGRDRVLTLVDTHAVQGGAFAVGDGVSVLTDPDLLDDEIVREHARVFVGYAGWAPGQLEAELRMGAWRVAPGSARDALDAPARVMGDERDPFESARDPFSDP